MVKPKSNMHFRIFNDSSKSPEQILVTSAGSSLSITGG